MPFHNASTRETDLELAPYMDLLGAIIRAAAKERFPPPKRIKDPDQAHLYSLKAALNWWRECAPLPDHEWQTFVAVTPTDDGPENPGYPRKGRST